MTDILEELESCHCKRVPPAMLDCPIKRHCERELKAAAEIRRLREDKKNWQHIASTSHAGERKALLEVERLKIQVQELKEALQEIASEYTVGFTKKEIARDALAKLRGDDADTDWCGEWKESLE